MRNIAFQMILQSMLVHYYYSCCNIDDWLLPLVATDIKIIKIWTEVFKVFLLNCVLLQYLWVLAVLAANHCNFVAVWLPLTAGEDYALLCWWFEGSTVWWRMNRWSVFHVLLKLPDVAATCWSVAARCCCWCGDDVLDRMQCYGWLKGTKSASTSRFGSRLPAKALHFPGKMRIVVSFQFLMFSKLCDEWWKFPRNSILSPQCWMYPPSMLVLSSGWNICLL